LETYWTRSSSTWFSAVKRNKPSRTVTVTRTPHHPAIILSVTPTEAAIREIAGKLARNDLTLLERAEQAPH
jgi:hypothetical protein